MASTPDLALLALRVYSTKGAADGSNVELNRPAVPTGWTELEWHTDDGSGFSYGVYRNGSEIVISYAGTNQGGDWATNIANGAGLGSTQTTKAALAYLQAKQQYGSNITFTGHSLGGGLASIMSVWFDRPAVVFDEATFELAAISPLIFLATKASLVLAGYNIGAFASYTGLLDFSSREQNVTNHYLEGEALYFLRLAAPTILGSGQDNEVKANIAGMTGLSGPIDLHSQGLLTAMLLSNDFRLATYASNQIIPRLMDDRLYALGTQGSAETVLIKFIRSEQGTGDILTNFAEDLQKLGTNIAGLNKQAQDAIIAQGIEWYYWQGTGYAGEKFFVNNPTSPTLLQYNSAVGASLTNAQDKAAIYVGKWLTPIYNANGAFSGRNSFDQWSVVADSTGVTATARDQGKSQIFIGQNGADKFTGGVYADVLMGGGGGDTLDGGTGYDLLYGGAGNDEYIFTGAFGADVIQDSDSAGLIKVDGTTLNGGKKVDDNVWESADGVYRYQFFSHGAANDLTIGRGSKATATQMQGSIVIKGWTGTGLGLTLDTAAPVVPPGLKNYNGDQRGPLAGIAPDQYYNWGTTNWDEATGILTNGVAEVNFADVIFASAVAGDNTVLHGNGGNDALAGSASKDEIFGDGGDDLIGGGAGSDNISGRAGIPSFLPQMEYGNTLVSRPFTKKAKSSLATMSSSETRHLGRRSKMIAHVKISSRPCKFHERRWHLSIKNRLRRSQYTFNGYLKGRFSESTDSGNAPTHSKAVSC